MKVHKFGGSSLKQPDGLAQCVTVIEHFSRKEITWVVMSALYGVTDQLLAAIRQATAGQAFDALLDDIEAMHREFCPSDFAPLDALIEQARNRLEGIRLLGACPDSAQVEILAAGERLSAQLFLQALTAKGLAPRYLPHDQALIAAGSALDAVVDLDASREQLKPLIGTTERLVVTPGFIACDRDGQLLTLGRNGTDYSASCLAAAIQADRCMIWKEVDGIYSANPELVPSARRLPQVSYAEAMELSHFGAKVIGAKAIAPLIGGKIPCEIRDVGRPDNPGTLIAKDSDTSIKGLTSLDGISLITIAGPGLRGSIGVANRVFGAMATHRISVLSIVQSSSEYSISLAVMQADYEAAIAALESVFHFERIHQLITRIDAMNDRSIVSLVGNGLWHRKGVAARLLSAVAAASINVEAIAQGPSERAITLVIKREHAAMAVRACHEAFFSEKQHLDVLLFGCGNVGATLLAQFRRQRTQLLDQNIALNIRAVANSRQWLVDHPELAGDSWDRALETHGESYRLEEVLALKQKLGLINPVMIDCTASPAFALQYADFVRHGFNVVAANKHANTQTFDDYRSLRQLCRKHFRQFLYETNVGAGLPLLDTLQGLMRSGDRLIEFNGVLSGSLSLICGLLEDGQSFSEAVADARARGFTEPDPREDLSGNDVARKLLIIAREVGMTLELDDIEVEPMMPAQLADETSLEDLDDALAQLNRDYAERVADARAEGRVLRYIASINDGRCRVSLQALDATHPLAAIRDGENALALHTEYYQPIPMVLRGYGAGAEVTAAGVFGDVLRTLKQPLEIY